MLSEDLRSRDVEHWGVLSRAVSKMTSLQQGLASTQQDSAARISGTRLLV
jgi:hypothetical protein